MKATVLQENLLAGLATVNHAVSKRSSLPVLGNILLSTHAGRLKLSATDLGIGITCEIAAAITEDGAITLPAKLLTEYVKAVPAIKIDLVLNVRNWSVNLDADRFKSNIKGIDAAEFPELPVAPEAPTLSLPAWVLCSAISQVVIACAPEGARPHLMGVYFAAEGKRLDLVATDSYRLARRSITLRDPVTEPLSAIVPTRTCREIARLAKQVSPDAEARLAFANGQNLLTINVSEGDSEPAVRHLTVTSTLIEGKFVDYVAIIPKRHKTRTALDLAGLQKAIKLAAPFADGNENRVRVKITPGMPGTVTTYAQAAEMGDFTGEMDAQVEGEAIEFMANAGFLSEALAVMSTEQMVLETTEATRPVVLKRIGDETFMYVLMPMDNR